MNTQCLWVQLGHPDSGGHKFTEPVHQVGFPNRRSCSSQWPSAEPYCHFGAFRRNMCAHRGLLAETGFPSGPLGGSWLTRGASRRNLGDPTRPLGGIWVNLGASRRSLDDQRGLSAQPLLHTRPLGGALVTTRASRRNLAEPWASRRYVGDPWGISAETG